MYKLTIENQSGSSRSVIIFHTNPPYSSNVLVWEKKFVPNQTKTTFSWNEACFSLGFGTVSPLLETGGTYTSNYDELMSPNDSNGNNQLNINYVNGSFNPVSSIHNASLNLGELQITTDTSFTVNDSQYLAVSLSIDKSPVLISQGMPNTYYQFSCHTTAYVAISSYAIGTILPRIPLPSSLPRTLHPTQFSINRAGNSLSSPTQLPFIAGEKTELFYTITENLTFIPTKIQLI